MMLDTTSEWGRHVERRLQQEIVIWLTTVGGNGAPHPSPVWFVWDGASIVIYSQPDTPKLRNVAAHPHVALNFDSDGRGGDIVIFNGTAEIPGDVPPSDQLPAYQEKYAADIAGIGYTPESFAAAYSVAVRVTPTRVRGE
jgi:PPOX class probable F420-dependent enzyme